MRHLQKKQREREKADIGNKAIQTIGPYGSIKEEREDGTYDISGVMKERQLKEAVKALIKKTLES